MDSVNLFDNDITKEVINESRTRDNIAKRLGTIQQIDTLKDNAVKAMGALTKENYGDVAELLLKIYTCASTVERDLEP